MLRILKWLFYGVAAVALIIVGGSFFLPSHVTVKRSIEIAAPPDKVFAIVGDLRRFGEFSPWAELDPDMKTSFEGAESGVGQVMRWTSDDPQVGNGVQTIVEHQPSTHVASEVEFDMGTSIASWDLAPVPLGTAVTWTFESDLTGIPAKWFGLMLENWIGADYEKGLARLKAVAEKAAPGPTAAG